MEKEGKQGILVQLKENLVELKDHLKERFLWDPLVKLKYRLRYRSEKIYGMLWDTEDINVWTRRARCWAYLKIVDGIENLVSWLLLWLSPMLRKMIKEGLIIATPIEWSPDDLIMP